MSEGTTLSPQHVHSFCMCAGMFLLLCLVDYSPWQTVPDMLLQSPFRWPVVVVVVVVVVVAVVVVVVVVVLNQHVHACV